MRILTTKRNVNACNEIWCECLQREIIWMLATRLDVNTYNETWYEYLQRNLMWMLATRPNMNACNETLCERWQRNLMRMPVTRLNANACNETWCECLQQSKLILKQLIFRLCRVKQCNKLSQQLKNTDEPSDGLPHCFCSPQFDQPEVTCLR